MREGTQGNTLIYSSSLNTLRTNQKKPISNILDTAFVFDSHLLSAFSACHTVFLRLERQGP